MALDVIPADLSNLTPGEKRVANKLKDVYSDIDYESYLYVQPRLKNLNPDFILIDAYKGICIIEVKDWDLEYIKDVDNVHVWDLNGKRLENPALKAIRYLNTAKNVLQSEKSFFDDKGTFNLRVFTRVVFTNIKSSDLDAFNPCFNQTPAECVGSDDLRKFSLNKLFLEGSCFLDEGLMSKVRALFFPEIKVKPVQTNLWKFNRKKCLLSSFIATLDSEQEKFARQIPYGHFMVTGVPGSGKTVILLSRAIHLVKEKPNWNIRVLTYNRTLAHQLQQRLEDLQDDLELMGVNYQNIKTSTFHSLASEVSTKPAPTIKNSEYWNNILPYNAIEEAVPTYDAVLIDEYQDFKNHWIKLCLLLCKKHEYNGKLIENLFLAGDRLQSIYNKKEHSWKSLGVNIVGRSKLLKTSYRSGSNHVNLALDYLMKDEKLRKEVTQFYEGRNNIVCNCEIDNNIDFIKGNIDVVNKYLKSLFSDKEYNPEDVLILVPTAKGKNGTEDIYKNLDEQLKVISKATKDRSGDKMDVITYHSSKGLECKVCVLMNVDAINDKKLLYVGMTRASEKLCIHSFSKDGGPTFNQLLSCYSDMTSPGEDVKSFNYDVESSANNKISFNTKEIKKSSPRAYMKWDETEETKLINLFNSGKSIEEIGYILGRNKGGVKIRLKKLGIFEEQDQNSLDVANNFTREPKINASHGEDNSYQNKILESPSYDVYNSNKDSIPTNLQNKSKKGNTFKDKIKKYTSFLYKK